MKDKLPPFIDAGSLSQTQRIKLIGRTVHDSKGVIGFIVDDKAKAAIYIKHLLMDYPDLVVNRQMPFEGSILVQVSHKENSINALPS